MINVTKADVALHNFLMYGREVEPEQFFDTVVVSLWKTKHLKDFRKGAGVEKQTYEG